MYEDTMDLKYWSYFIRFVSFYFIRVFIYEMFWFPSGLTENQNVGLFSMSIYLSMLHNEQSYNSREIVQHLKHFILSRTKILNIINKEYFSTVVPKNLMTVTPNTDVGRAGGDLMFTMVEENTNTCKTKSKKQLKEVEDAQLAAHR